MLEAFTLCLAISCAIADQLNGCEVIIFNVSNFAQMIVNLETNLETLVHFLVLRWTSFNARMGLVSH